MPVNQQAADNLQELINNLTGQLEGLREDDPLYNLINIKLEEAIRLKRDMDNLISISSNKSILESIKDAMKKKPT